MAKHENQMFTGEIMFLDILVFFVASVYWYMTGHEVAAILGYVFVSIFIYSDELYFVSLIMGVVTLIAIIFFIFYDYNLYQEENAISEVGIASIYMFVIFLKSRSIFNAD
ncbi:MAG: hypothetical protein J7K14_02120 [Sulfurimonas sp.]|nr:hypothetical protein [Sulfurimonas sp.]